MKALGVRHIQKIPVRDRKGFTQREYEVWRKQKYGQKDKEQRDNDK